MDGYRQSGKDSESGLATDAPEPDRLRRYRNANCSVLSATLSSPTRTDTGTVRRGARGSERGAAATLVGCGFSDHLYRGTVASRRRVYWRPRATSRAPKNASPNPWRWHSSDGFGLQNCAPPPVFADYGRLNNARKRARLWQRFTKAFLKASTTPILRLAKAELQSLPPS